MAFTVKIHSSGSVLVNLLDDPVQLRLRQLRIELMEDLLQGGDRDVAVAC